MVFKYKSCKNCDLIKEYMALDKDHDECIEINNKNILKLNEYYKKYKEQIIEIRQLKDNNNINSCRFF